MRYDAAIAPDPEAWLALDWLAREDAVRHYHLVNRQSFVGDVWHIDPARLREQAEACVKDFAAMFDPSGDHAAAVANTIAALQAFVHEAPNREDRTKATGEALRTARSALRSLTRGRALQWRDWCKLCKLGAAKKCKDLATSINEAARQHMRSPELWRDVRRSIELCFGLAADALQRYQDHKRAWGTMDFTDQEVFALEALRREDLRTRLIGSIDLVLVDEFQDTSPLQLAIFVELASIAKRSVWVGDQKQAIYGFRGTDPELMDAAIATILGGDEPETLARSWRSRAPLVELTSEAFAAAFEPHGIPASRVRLSAALKGDPATLGPVLETWTLSSTNLDRDPYAVADGIAQLLADESVLVRERSFVREGIDPTTRSHPPWRRRGSVPDERRVPDRRGRTRGPLVCAPRCRVPGCSPRPRPGRDSRGCGSSATAATRSPVPNSRA